MKYWEQSRKGLVTLDSILIVHPDRLSCCYSHWAWLGVTVIFDGLSPA